MRNTLDVPLGAGGVGLGTDAISQAPDSVGDEPLFGRGPLPSSLDNLNFSALFWDGLWALVYRDWPWLIAFLAVRLAGLSFFGWFNIATTYWKNPAIAVPVSIASASATWLLAIFFSFAANRRLWERQVARPTSLSTKTVATYLKTQRDFGWVGFAMTVVGAVSILVRLGGTARFSKAGALAGFVAEVILIAGAWAIARRRTRRLAAGVDI